MITLDAALLCNMSIGKVFRDSENLILGLEFSDDGTLLAAYNETTLHIYDVQIAKKIKTLNNKLTKISKLRFTHCNTAVVFVGGVAPYDLYYWSIYENEIVKVFKGSLEHKLNDLVVNPVNDLAVTVDAAGCLRIYSLHSAKAEPAIVMDYNNQVTDLAANFNYFGTVLVVAIAYVDQNGEKLSKVEFHDMRDKYNGVFFRIFLEDACPVKSIQHDQDGRLIACLQSSGALTLINALDGSIFKTIRGAIPMSVHLPEFSFSPDSRFILAGSEQGQIKVFEVESGKEIAKYSGHSKPCLSVKFSPAHVMFASACQNVIFWIPKYWDHVYN